MKAISIIVLLAVLLLAAFSFWLRSRETSNRTLAQDAPMSSAKTTSSLPVGPIAPDIATDTWLNSARLSAADLRGKVVLVEFWTFGCINCRNVIPALRSWHDKYSDQGLVIIGVHTPEFTYEHDLANVKQAIQDQRIEYPVTLDNDFKIWNAYRVYAWPTWFILDKQGAIRFTHVGEGAYAESEGAIVELLRE
ncbi:MAG: redoxin domain-containing protein [Chloroflexi bacterium]|nr:redoxin domain-containing protein [Chloroflexota bacterium]